MSSTDTRSSRRSSTGIGPAVLAQMSASPRSSAPTGGGGAEQSSGMSSLSRSTHTLAADRLRVLPNTAGK